MRPQKPVPEIDFSLHNMEDGTQVSTMERVVKGEFNRDELHKPWAVANPNVRGASAYFEYPVRRGLLVA